MVAGKQKRMVVFDAYCKNESGLEGMPGVVFNVVAGVGCEIVCLQFVS